MISLARQAAAGELSVRETERLAKVINDKKKPASIVKKPSFFVETELALGELLNTKVKITDGKKKMLCIEFSDEEELKDIVNRF
jgi:hypothetical protein